MRSKRFSGEIFEGNACRKIWKKHPKTLIYEKNQLLYRSSLQKVSSKKCFMFPADQSERIFLRDTRGVTAWSPRGHRVVIAWSPLEKISLMRTSEREEKMLRSVRRDFSKSFIHGRPTVGLLGHPATCRTGSHVVVFSTCTHGQRKQNAEEARLAA